MQEELKTPTFFQDYQKLTDSISTLIKGKQGYGYTYTELNDVLDEIEPKIKECGFLLIQTVVRGEGTIRRSDSAVPVIKDKDGSVVLTSRREFECPCYELHTELIHNSGRILTCEMPLLVDDIDPQALGSAETYMRRYSLLALLKIKTKDDDGVSASARGKMASSRPPLPKEVKDIANFLMNHQDPKIYYGELKKREDITPQDKQKLAKIMYPN